MFRAYDRNSSLARSALRFTPSTRYELLLQRCPGIVEHLDLQDLAFFLCITPNYLSTIRKSITFESKK